MFPVYEVVVGWCCSTYWRHENDIGYRSAMCHDENLCLAVQLDLLCQGHLLYSGNPELSTQIAH